MATVELTCQELVERVTDYLDGALPHRERVRFEEHLAICAGCRAYLEQMRFTIRTLGRLSEQAIDARVREELLWAFRDWKRQN